MKKEYRNDKGELHRTDGPAYYIVGGYKAWYLNGELHRTDGPARKLANGTEEWYLNGKRHRTDGPTIIETDGTKEWWVNNVKLTEEQIKIAKKINKDPNWNEIPLYLNDPLLSVIIDVVIKGT